jgi:hypothetical protein
MTTPTVTEIHRPLEAVTPDPFIAEQRTARRLTPAGRTPLQSRCDISRPCPWGSVLGLSTSRRTPTGRPLRSAA